MGDSAGVLGCGASTHASWQQRALLCEHAGATLHTLAVCDAAASTIGLVTALSHAGLHSAVATLTAQSGRDDPAALEAKWECAWRLSQWEDSHELVNHQGPFTTGASPINGCRTRVDSSLSRISFHQSVYTALLNITKESSDKSFISDLTNAARSSLLPRLPSWHNLTLGQLSLLSELDTTSINTAEQLLARWKVPVRGPSSRAQELVLAGRAAVLQQMLRECSPQADKDLHGRLSLQLHHTLLARSNVGRVLSVLGICESSLHKASSIEGLDHLAQAEQTVERSTVAMVSGQFLQSQNILERLLEQLKSNGTDRQLIVYCRALLLQGEVLLKTRAVPITKILEDHFQTSIELLERPNAVSNDLKCVAFAMVESSSLQMARISDKLYREARNFLNSEEVAVQRNNIKRGLASADKIMNIAKNTHDEKEKKSLMRRSTENRRNAILDQQNLFEKEKAMGQYLLLSLTQYLRCLTHSTCSHLPPYRLLSLWFENSDNDAVNDAVRDNYPRLQRHLLVPLLYQLMARVTTAGGHFTNTLNTVITDMCKRHPHHALPVLLMLAHAHFDDTIVNDAAAKSSDAPRKRQKSTPKQEGEHMQQQDEDRVAGAKRLVDVLKQSELKEHLFEMEMVCQAYLHLANYGDSIGCEAQHATIPRQQPLMRLPSLQYTASLTVPVAVQPSEVYAPPLLLRWEAR